MGRIEVVSFDMEGTLVDHRFSNLIWETDIPRLYAEQRGISLGAAREHVLGEYRKVGDERPEWYDVTYWFRRLGLAGDWRELLEQRRDTCRDYPEARGVLERLRDGYVLIVTSNTIREFLEVQLRGLAGFFAHVFSAPSDFGEVKRSADFYRRICRLVGVEPEAMAHVGDHHMFDYEAPRQLGIQAYFLDRSGEAEGDRVVHDLVEFEHRVRMLDGGPIT
ncbi:MAG: HAD family hydrolase [Candidatus Bathyarchaeia archaeon]